MRSNLKKQECWTRSEYISFILDEAQNIVSNAKKVALIIQILKPDNATKEEWYQRISILSTVTMVFDALLLATLKEHFSLDTHQHGFREFYSTTTTMNLIANQITNGPNRQRACLAIVAAIDVSMAFDTIGYCTLINDISHTSLFNGV